MIMPLLIERTINLGRACRLRWDVIRLAIQYRIPTDLTPYLEPQTYNLSYFSVAPNFLSDYGFPPLARPSSASTPAFEPDSRRELLPSQGA